MKPLKLIMSVAGVACALAVSGARAQVTNLVTFNVLTYNQGATNDNGTTTTWSITKAPRNTPQLLQGELGGLLNTNGLSSAAKLVLITGPGTPVFGVVDGTTFYDLSASNVMTMSMGDLRVRSGTQSDLSTPRKTVDMQLISVQYDDTGIGGTLRFTLTGLGTISQTDTAPANGTYTETIKAKISNMSGEGTGDGNPFVAIGIMNVSGKGTLPAIF